MTDQNPPQEQPAQPETLDERMAREKKDFEENRRDLRVDVPEKPIEITIYHKENDKIITSVASVINFSLGGLLIRSNETYPAKVPMKIVYKRKAILVEVLRSQGNMYGVRYYHVDQMAIYEFYFEMIHQVIFEESMRQ